jgi:protocatechuate 3,4-dioxygenase beta subunit
MAIQVSPASNVEIAGGDAMLTLVGLVVALSLSQAAPVATTGGIAGRVMVEGGNTPIAGARVMLFPMGRPNGPMIGGPPQAITDQEGRFAFDRLAPGEYRLDAQKTGFAPLFNPVARGRPSTIQVVAGQTVDGVRVQLQRGGVIAGKVLDPSGEPFTDARVMAMRRINQPSDGAPPRFMPAPMQGSQQTNDLGEFRLSGLAPGEYYIAAMRGTNNLGVNRSAAPPASNGSARTMPTTTFYPGAADPAGAQSVAVASGAEVSSLVFTMQSAPAFRVSGVVVGDDGTPVARAMVMLVGDPRNGMFMGPAGNAQSGEDGRFVIDDVSAGSYRAQAMVPMTVGASGAGGTGGIVSLSSSDLGRSEPPAEIVVTDADVRGVRVIVRRPSQ